MNSLEEIQKDIDELNALLSQATRNRNKDFLILEIRRLQTDLIRRQEQQKAKETESQEGKAAVKPTPTGATPALYKELIQSYAWDQSDKFLKLYVTLKGVHSLDKSAISCQFTDQSVKMEVKGLNGKNCELFIKQLSESIVPESSYHKVKTDMVLVVMKKVDVGTTWPYVTYQEKKQKAAKKDKKPKEDDPSAGLMSVLKDLYDDGDDEMKRTISKSFYESQMGKKQNDDMS